MTTDEFPIPEDLKKALKEAGIQYKSQEIRKVEDFRVEGNLLSLVPSPEANESWPGGTLIIRDGQTNLEPFSSEIIEYDYDDGRVYVERGKWKAPDDLTHLKFHYKPFDYSTVLVGAFEKLQRHPLLFQKAIASSCGLFSKETESELPQIKPLPESSNKSAVVDGVARLWQLSWAMIWGPPGTGKTQTVAEALCNFASDKDGGKVLVVTPTNAAADAVALRLCSLLDASKTLMQGKDCCVYRGGRGSGKDLRKAFPQCLRNNAYAKKYDELITAIAELEEERDIAASKQDFHTVAALSKKIKTKQASLPDETKFVIESREASAVKVVILTTFKACTFVGGGDDPVFFDKVIIDEAGMVSRATCAAVSSLGKTVILVGDPKQIGPIFASPPGLSKDVRKWLLMSGLSHLESVKASSGDARVLFLDKQYRMHPEISKAVSDFTYDGILKDADPIAQLLTNPPLAKDLPVKRAAYWVVDDIVSAVEDACPQKPKSGIGWQRKASAEAAVKIAAVVASTAQRKVIILSPYRAQVRGLNKLIKALPYASHGDKIKAGTIHRQQGAECDVVILDLVRGALSWGYSEIEMLLNVALSRAKLHFILIVSHAELNTPVLSRFAKHLAKEDAPSILLNDQQTFKFTAEKKIEDGRGQDEPNLLAKTLGDEVRVMRQRSPLYSAAQQQLLDRNIGDGHWLVRGVAGSGKSLILVNWVVRLLKKQPDYKILITFYNKGMHNLMYAMMRESCERLGISSDPVIEAVTIEHIDRMSCDNEKAEMYDAVFVDEAQDIDSDKLKRIYNLCREHKMPDGRRLRSLIFFYDDSQNIYGRKTLEELKEELPGKIVFTGRTSVLREAYRSTQAILSFAINMALDPRKIMFQDRPGLLEFFKVPELASEGLIIRPEDSGDGYYHVRYTDSIGTAPIVVEGSDEEDVFNKIALEIKSLIDKESVLPGDILVITVVRPERAAQAIKNLGIAVAAYAGQGNNDAIDLPARDITHVRCTTVFSCKGHEAPIVFFANFQEVEKVSSLKLGNDKSDEEKRRMKRCMLYVASSRAMVRLYIYGNNSPYLTAAKEYASAESAPPGLL